MPSELQRVMLVEDDPDIQAVAMIALEDVGGLQVEACSTGMEALQQVAGFQPDLILLDVMMPGMTGPDTLRALRERPDARDTPVVFMTAKVQKHEVQGYLDLGAIGVIPKPFEPMTLADQLRELLQSARRNRAQEDEEERLFQAKLSALQQRFSQDLPQRLQAVQNTWAAVQRGEQTVRDLIRQAHSLVGTARTLQLPDVGAVAAELEAHLEVEQAGVLTNGRERVQDIIERLEAVIQVHVGGT